MAEFTPDINGPQSAWMIGRGAEAPKSLIGGIADVLTKGAEQGIDIFRTDKQRSLQAAEGEELSQSVRDYANGQASQNPSGNTPAPAGAPQLLGQQTNPAQNDPGYQSATAEMDKHASAAAQGAPGAKQALLTRLSEIQSRYATQNPYYAPALADYAKGILGFNANEQLYSAASEAEEFQKRMQEGAQTILLNKAAEAGAAHFNPDGTVDIHQTMMNGQAMLAAEQQTKAALSQAQLAQAQAKPQMTMEQQTDQEFRIAQPAVKTIIDGSTGGLFSNLKGVLDKWDASKPMDQAVLAQTIGRTEAQAEFAVDKFADANNIGFQTRQNLKAYVKSEFAPFATIMGTDLTSAKQISQAVQKLKDSYFIKLSEVAPHVAAAITIGGPNAAAALVQGFTSPATTNPSFETMNKELGDYFSVQPSPGEVLRGVNGAMAGKYSIGNEPDPVKAKAVATNSIPVLDHFTSQPKLDDKAQAAFGNLMSATAEAAVGSNDPATILNVAPHVLRPGATAAMIAYAKNPANANNAEKVMAYYGQYVERARLESAKVLQTGADTRLVNIDPVTHKVGHAIQVHYSVEPGANGDVQPMFTARDNQGNNVSLTDAQKRQVLKQDPNFVRTVSTFNQANKADAAVSQAFKAEQAPKPKGGQQAAAGNPKPTPEQLATNHVFANKVTELFPGAKVLSGYRTPEENRRAGGVANSGHLTASALDFMAPGKTKAEVRASLEAEGLPITELLDSTDEGRQGVGHMKPGEFHWSWAEKRVASR